MSTDVWSRVYSNLSKPLAAAGLFAAYKWGAGQGSLYDVIVNKDTAMMAGAVLGAGLLASEALPALTNAAGVDLMAQRTLLDPAMTGATYALLRYFLAGEKDTAMLMRNAFTGITTDLYAHALSDPVVMLIKQAGVTVPAARPATKLIVA